MSGWGDVTGRMTALTHSGSVVYAAAASGGVWRSTNNGKTWIETNAGLPRLSVGALATNPADGSVWVGTGEANNASENQYGVGVFRLAKGSTHMAAGRRLRAVRRGHVPHRLDQRVRLRRDQPRPVPACGGCGHELAVEARSWRRPA